LDIEDPLFSAHKRWTKKRFQTTGTGEKGCVGQRYGVSGTQDNAKGTRGAVSSKREMFRKEKGIKNKRGGSQW